MLAICNHACLCNVSCDCLLTCNCVKRAALLIWNARPHQCLMQSLSLFHFSPSLSLSLSLSLSICGNSLAFGIDLPLAANEKELCFLGLEAVGPRLSLGVGSACDFWVLTSTLAVYQLE